jgi:hypothetical protein
MAAALAAHPQQKHLFLILNWVTQTIVQLLYPHNIGFPAASITISTFDQISYRFN